VVNLDSHGRPDAFTKPLPGVDAPRNVILPPSKMGQTGLAWDFIYVRDDIAGATGCARSTGRGSIISAPVDQRKE